MRSRRPLSLSRQLRQLARRPARHPDLRQRPQARHLSQDKYKRWALAGSVGVRTPEALLASSGAALSPAPLPGDAPLFVRPNRLGAKIGITADARCPDLASALALSRRLFARYGDDVLIQTYVPGEDVRVSCMDLGRGEPGLGIYRVGLTAAGRTRPFPTLDDSRAITQLRAAGQLTSRQQPRDLRISDLAAEASGDPLRAAQLASIRDATWWLARLLGLRDYFSLDFRIGTDGEVYVLELEVCPAVTIYDFLTYLADAYGLGLPAALVEAAMTAHDRRLTSPDR